MTTPAPALQFRVAGLPATQGSKKLLGARGHPVIVDANAPKLMPWREAIRCTAVDAAGPGWVPLTGPIRISLLFALRKPTASGRRRRPWPIGARSGDLDKLVRAAFDALTDAGIWRDDSQAVNVHAVKDYPEYVQQMCPGVLIALWPVEPLIPAHPTPGAAPTAHLPEHAPTCCVAT